MSSNATTNEVNEATTEEYAFNNLDDTQITTLFPLLGIAIMIISAGYFILGITTRSSFNFDGQQPREENDDNDKYGLDLWTLLILIALFFFFYVGAEVSYGLYIATFAVECEQHLTKTQGAEITSIFWASFALMRFASIFTSIYLKPIYIMDLSFIVSLIGALALILYGNQILLALQVGSALLGFGMASIYATGLLWLSSYLKITNRIGAAMSCASGIGNVQI